MKREHVIEGAVVREHIVQTHTLHSPAAAGAIADADNFILAAAHDGVLDPTRPTRLEAFLTERLVADGSRPSAGVWSKINTKFAAFKGAYGALADPSEFVKAALDQIIDPAFDAAQPKAADTAMKEFSKIVGKGFKAAVERSVEIQFDRFLTELAGDASVSDALSHVARAPAHAVGLTEAELNAARQVVEAIDDHAERVEQWVERVHTRSASREMPADAQEVRRLAEQVDRDRERLWADTGSGRRSRPSMEYLAGYDDYFANSKSSAASTLRATMLAEAGRPVPDSELYAAVNRARNYAELSVFKRVGGVLIGRHADNEESSLDGFSLRWEEAPGGRITIVLSDSSGQETALGPYAPDIIYRALLFAADGRPLVVTIINTGLSEFQKIIMHPDLVDTVIGCEMIELDSFVFHYLDEQHRGTDSQAMERVEGYDGLYVFALLHGHHAQAPSSNKAELEEAIDAHVARYTKPRLEAALVDPLLFSDRRQSPLAAGYRIYKGPL